MSNMKLFAAAVLLSGTFLMPSSVIAQEAFPVLLEQDANSLEIAGTIKGDSFADYILSAQAGQVLSVILSPSSASVNFNVMPEGNPEAIYIGAIYGPEFVGRLPAGGDYTIRVYQLGAAADEGRENTFTLSIGLDVETLPEQDDAKVEGTEYNAVGEVGCTFEANPDFSSCDFGVRRNGDGPANVFITTPSGFVRELAFAADGSITAPGWDGPLSIERKDDVTTLSINGGEEDYRVPDVVVFGD